MVKARICKPTGNAICQASTVYRTHTSTGTYRCPYSRLRYRRSRQRCSAGQAAVTPGVRICVHVCMCSCGIVCALTGDRGRWEGRREETKRKDESKEVGGKAIAKEKRPCETETRHEIERETERKDMRLIARESGRRTYRQSVGEGKSARWGGQ